MGVNLAEFWHLTPHSLYLIAQGYNRVCKRQIESQNAIAHLQGAYIAEAIMATVGNMLSSKNSKKHDYPDKPYDLHLDETEDQKERENERKLDLFAAQLTARMNNFNLNLSKEQGQS